MMLLIRSFASHQPHLQSAFPSRRKMAALRGERFHIDLSDDETSAPTDKSSKAGSTPGLVGDVLEKPPSKTALPPAPPSRSTATGFPAHKKRSRFMRSVASSPKPSSEQTVDTVTPSAVQSRQPQQQQQTPAAPQATSLEQTERKRIGEENNARIASMSPEQIEKERAELMSSLNPVLLQRLLNRAKIDEASEPEDFPGLSAPSQSLAPESEKPSVISQDHDPERPQKPQKTVTFAEPTTERPPISTSPPPHHPQDQPLQPQTTQPPSVPDIHFPHPPQPDLDPSAPTFLSDLHTKYFPSLPHDPSKLAWMSPDPATDSTPDPYSPRLATLEVTALRFDFRGRLIPPSLAASIPVTAGLHHHGDAPDAAGYTIPELVHLSRSAVASQRCIAYQVLGRVLYRLGTGEWGRCEEEGERRVLVEGLWGCMERGRVFETLQEEAGRTKGHLSARAYATEALWFWRRGGGYRPGPESVVDTGGL